MEQQESSIQDAELRVNSLSREIQNLQLRKAEEIHTVKNIESDEILKIQQQMIEDIFHERAGIDDVISNRNFQIGLLEEITTNMIPLERNAQITPLIARRDYIKNLEQSLLSTLRSTVAERTGVLQQIHSFNVEMTIKQSTIVYIPFWIIRIRRRSGIEQFVIPPSTLQKPSVDKLSRWNFINILHPISAELKSSACYLLAEKFMNNANYSSILQDGINIDIDCLISNQYINPNLARRMKQYFQQNSPWRD